ncbi:protocatechuate dioxygenase-like protein, partial [Leptotrombidium deliense]
VTEGPFFIESVGNSEDIRDGQLGLPFILCTTIVHQHTCHPISKATVYIWVANAYGLYSGYENVTGPDFPNNPISDTRYLRGYQTTGSAGSVCFTMIYPGWYPGRTTHIHVEVYIKSRFVFVGQLFFDDKISDFVYNHYCPYNTRDNNQRVKNADDTWFNKAGDTSVLDIKPTLYGYFSEIKMAIDPLHESDHKWPKN